jgi:hypothetical protein
MKKEDCKKGMLVIFGEDKCRGVIVKLNPKRAKVNTLDPHKNRMAGLTWSVPYSMMWPMVGGDEISNQMVMTSFQKPNDPAIRAWSEAQKNRPPKREYILEDALVMQAIHTIYERLDLVLIDRDRRFLSEKINLLFRVIGRDVSKSEADEWMLERTRADGN